MSFLFRRNTVAKPSLTPPSDWSELAELILILKKYSKSSRHRELPPHLELLLQQLDEIAPSSRALVPQPSPKRALALYSRTAENGRAIAHRRRFTIDKIVFLCSCAYLLGVAGWVYQTRVSSPEQVVQGNIHRSIISYMGRSLQAIEPPQPPQPAQTPQKTLPVPPVKPLPTITAVPVTPKISTPNPPPVPPQPAAATPSPAPPSTVPVLPKAPVVTPPPVAASPKAPSTPVLTAKAPVPPPPTIQTPAYRLVGLVELGDRSVALININNVTQRVAIGETIGASGWTLEAVTAQSVALNRNGEKRSLYVGQDF